ncbi:MAG: DUF1194 domain-containing protein [Rhodobacteraceae bacterium]|nr:DUF1194 domain-containing protein [Paracoccaceae bacterium]
MISLAAANRISVPIPRPSETASPSAATPSTPWRSEPRLGDIRQADISELSSYFNAYVILGPDVFIQVALGFEDCANEMTRKPL